MPLFAKFDNNLKSIEIHIFRFNSDKKKKTNKQTILISNIFIFNKVKCHIQPKPKQNSLVLAQQCRDVVFFLVPDCFDPVSSLLFVTMVYHQQIINKSNDLIQIYTQWSTHTPTNRCFTHHTLIYVLTYNVILTIKEYLLQKQKQIRSNISNIDKINDWFQIEFGDTCWNNLLILWRTVKMRVLDVFRLWWTNSVQYVNNSFVAYSVWWQSY